MFATLNITSAAEQTDDRETFAATLEKLTNDQLRVLARRRFGARPTTKNRATLIASIVAMFDATASFTR